MVRPCNGNTIDETEPSAHSNSELDMRVVSTAFASLSVDDAASVGMQAGEAGPSGDAPAAVPAAAAKGRKKKKVDEGKKK